MMQGDDIRNHRQTAEKDALRGLSDQHVTPDHYPAQISLALWVIAEQLFELRALLGITIERKPVQIFVNGGEVTAKGE